MNIYKEINREITLKNQELKSFLAARTAEVNHLQCQLLYCREENKALRELIMEVVHKNSQQYNRLIIAVSNEFGYQQQQQQHQQSISMQTASPTNRQSTRLSKSLNVSKCNSNDPLMIALAQSRRSSTQYNGTNTDSQNGDTMVERNDDDTVDNEIENKEEMLFEPTKRRRLSLSKKSNDSGDDDLDENVENIQPDVEDNLPPDPSDAEQSNFQFL